MRSRDGCKKVNFKKKNFFFFFFFLKKNPIPGAHRDRTISGALLGPIAARLREALHRKFVDTGLEARGREDTAGIDWPENDTRRDAKKFKVKVPTDLKDDQIRTPNYVDITVMNRKAKEKRVGSAG